MRHVQLRCYAQCVTRHISYLEDLWPSDDFETIVPLTPRCSMPDEEGLQHAAARQFKVSLPLPFGLASCCRFLPENQRPSQLQTHQHQMDRLHPGSAEPRISFCERILATTNMTVSYRRELSALLQAPYWNSTSHCAR